MTKQKTSNFEEKTESISDKGDIYQYFAVLSQRQYVIWQTKTESECIHSESIKGYFHFCD